MMLTFFEYGNNTLQQKPLFELDMTGNVNIEKRQQRKLYNLEIIRNV